MIRAYILDDEKHAIKSVSSLLTRYKTEFDNEIVGTSQSPIEAKLQIEELKPNVLFCDIEMPDLNGIELVKELKLDSTIVIFVTAYRDYAVEAFGVDAFNYLVKPLSPIAFKTCLQKVTVRLGELEEITTSNIEDPTLNSQLAFKKKEGYEIVDAQDVYYIISEGSYTRYVLSDSREILKSKNLKHCLSSLPEEDFLRISRSSAINVNQIESFSFSGGGHVKMNDNKSLFIGKTYRSEIFTFLRQRFMN